MVAIENGCICQDCAANGYECDLEAFDGADQCPPCARGEHPNLQPDYQADE